MSVLSGLMAVQFRNAETFVQDLETWESLVLKYETDSGEMLSDTVKAAVLLKGLTSKLQEVVRMSGTSVSDYDAMVSALTRYVRAGQRFDVTGSLVSGSRAHHDDPMDIGFVKGKGKGKGKSSNAKGSGSKGSKGKGSGKQDRSQTPETRTCHKCGRVGHLAKHCYVKTTSDPRNTGKGSGWSNQNTKPLLKPQGKRERKRKSP